MAYQHFHVFEDNKYTVVSHLVRSEFAFKSCILTLELSF